MQKFINWGLSTKTLSLARGFLASLFSRVNLEVISNNSPHKLPIIKKIKRIKRETSCLIGDQEAYVIYVAVKNSLKIEGDLAEVGTYKGGSARIICEAKGDRTLHLFDTFEGLPKLSEIDDSSQVHKGQFKASYNEVQRYLSKYPNVHLYKGLFPDTAGFIKERRFSFIHIDVDIYESTLNCLSFFYARMNKGAILISHDYNRISGVKKAFDEFFKQKEEVVLECGTSQCIIVKL